MNVIFSIFREFLCALRVSWHAVFFFFFIYRVNA